jgi:hypothetical protein
MLIRALLMVLSIALALLASGAAMAMPCQEHALLTIDSSEHPAAHRMAKHVVSHHPSDTPAPISDPCKIACAALCLSLSATIAPEQVQTLFVGQTGARFQPLEASKLVGRVPRPPLQPPQLSFA